MRNAVQLREEAMALFDDGDSRTFEDIYGKGQIFEDNEDIIHPKMRKLFEEVHEASRPIQGASRRIRETEELQEETEQLDESEQLEEEAPKYDLASTKDTPRPSGDGVPNGHNPPLSKGPTSQVTQSGARQDDNSKLGNEPPMGFGAGPRKRQQENVNQENMTKLFEDVYRKTENDDTKLEETELQDMDQKDMTKLFEEVYMNVTLGENAGNRLEESEDCDLDE